MIKEWPIYHQLRLTLEALTPHGVQTGFGDTTHDVLLVRDANGLPALPATSIAGVLRHLYDEKASDENDTSDLFGYAEGTSGQPSRIRFTWGLAHDSTNTPAEGLVTLPEDDSVLDLLRKEKPLVRQRVRLNERGAAADKGKFDVTLVPAGCRYTCFISCWSNGSEAHEVQWQRLLEIIQSEEFRLGHGTRTGQGAFHACNIAHGKWDLRNPADRTAYLSRPRRRNELGTLATLDSRHKPTATLTTYTQPLVAEAGWRIGGGDVSLTASHDDSGRAPDMLPQSEPRIVWTGPKATVDMRQVVVPASAIKGALAHRLAFHDRCLQEQWVDDSSIENSPSTAVCEIFGQASTATEEARAGCVMIDDMYLENTTATRQMHNRIDRFTGGVIRGALFEEELLWQTPLTLKLRIKPGRTISDTSREALKRTLDDLARGWLPLGAGGSRGNGIFRAEDQGQWSDHGRWLEHGDPA